MISIYSLEKAMSENSTATAPAFLYGTAWKEETTRELTLLALENGFRGIDTANQRKHYFEAAVGEGIAEFLKENEISREDLFLQTKFTYQAGQDHRLPYNPESTYSTQVEESFASSLEHLQTNYIDSYLLHGPFSRSQVHDADIEVWEAMEKLYEQGVVKSIGASNLNIQQLVELYAHAKIKPSFLQNRCYAHMGWDAEVRRFCLENNIVYQGFSLLTANRSILSHPALKEIAQREGKTAAQIIFSFSLQVGMQPLSGTTNANHMLEDLETTALRLPGDDIRLIEKLGLET